MRPKQRVAWANKMRAKRKTSGRKPATPDGWNYKQYGAVQDEAHQEAIRIYKILEKNDQLPTDAIAREAIQGALALMREPGNKEFKLKTIRTLLEYTHAKPTAKSDVTVRTAEDFLDSIKDA